jgi:hypothetical protein
MKFSAEWTDDCCGKNNCDSDVLRVSTRYRSREGSRLMSFLDRELREMETAIHGASARR